MVFGGRRNTYNVPTEVQIIDEHGILLFSSTIAVILAIPAVLIEDSRFGRAFKVARDDEPRVK